MSEPRTGTRERLLATAEELFATRGIDAVSVRDITEAAGANIAAVNYHFGSRRGLIDAIVERRADALGTRRAELLDALNGAGPVDIRALIQAMVLPTAELADVRSQHALRGVVPHGSRRSPRPDVGTRRVRPVDRALPRRAARARRRSSLSRCASCDSRSPRVW